MFRFVNWLCSVGVSGLSRWVVWARVKLRTVLGLGRVRLCRNCVCIVFVKLTSITLVCWCLIPRLRNSVLPGVSVKGALGRFIRLCRGLLGLRHLVLTSVWATAFIDRVDSFAIRVNVVCDSGLDWCRTVRTSCLRRPCNLFGADVCTFCFFLSSGLLVLWCYSSGVADGVRNPLLISLDCSVVPTWCPTVVCLLPARQIVWVSVMKVLLNLVWVLPLWTLLLTCYRVRPMVCR